MSKEIFLSKSLYLNGLQCKKYLWLKKYNEKKLQKPDASQEAIFKTGKTEKVPENAKSFNCFVAHSHERKRSFTKDGKRSWKVKHNQQKH